MTEKAFEPDDPMALVGVIVDAGDPAADEMARCLVEEYLRVGWDEEGLLRLFRTPFYRALYAIYRDRGEEAVRGLIAEVAATWGVWRVTGGGPRGGGEGDA
ncbi:MAG: hypothetical protein QN168_10525 [Armatimonadota bacterium]|nr:hypothetical protein [Armatimonadota bacterium]